MNKQDKAIITKQYMEKVREYNAMDYLLGLIEKWQKQHPIPPEEEDRWKMLRAEYMFKALGILDVARALCAHDDILPDAIKAARDKGREDAVRMYHNLLKDRNITICEEYKKEKKFEE